VNLAKTDEAIEARLDYGLGWAEGSMFYMEPRSLCEGAGKGHTRACPTTICRKMCKNCWINRFAVWVVDSGGPKETEIQPYSPGCANVPCVCGCDAVLCQITV